MKRTSILATASIFLSTAAYAWGPIGHRATGQIADVHLSRVASASCNLILETYTLAQMANYLDEMRTDPNYGDMAHLHFVSMDDVPDYEHEKADPTGDLATANVELYNFLKTKDLNVLTIAALKAHVKSEKEAITDLDHFIADIHQPLHVGKRADKGANSIKVIFNDVTGPVETSLHVVIDELMLNFTKMSATELAAQVDHITPAQKQEIENPRNLGIHDLIVSWADEAWKLVPDLYDFPDGVNANGTPIISYKYIAKVRPILERQLLKGGVRLAYLLNTIYENRPLPP